MICVDIATAARLDPGPCRGDEHLYRCPRHDDEHPSLSINAKRNVWMCGPCGAKGTAWQLAAFVAGVPPSNKAAVVAWLTEQGLPTTNGAKPAVRGSGRIVATYPYENESGHVLFEVVRFEPKDFRQRKPDGTRNLDGVRRVLYRLPEVLRRNLVYIVEGEKDADHLRAIGITATCNPGGAGKWRPEYADSFKPNQSVVILPDNDEPGRKHAVQVAESLADRVASVRILELTGLPPKGDVSDWLVAGGTRETLNALAQEAPEFKPDRPGEDRNVMRFTSLADLLNEEDENTRWLVENHLPAGGDSLLVAKPKVGKSTLARCLALAVARGENFLGRNTVQGSVFYLALEEKRSEVKRHFRAMGARNEPILIFCAPSPEDGLRQLRTAAEKEKPSLIIVDPLFRFTRIKDGNDYAAVTTALEPLHTLARETAAHVLAVHHEGKRGGDGGDGVLGSTALFAAVDTLLTM